jgi:hydrogenase nickel incorporation protein HypA/HybF
MHELGITQDVVTTVSDAANGRRVVKVTLAIGALAGVEADAIRFCFDVVAKGTALEGAVVEVVALAGAEMLIQTVEVEEAS